MKRADAREAIRREMGKAAGIPLPPFMKDFTDAMADGIIAALGVEVEADEPDLPGGLRLSEGAIYNSDQWLESFVYEIGATAAPLGKVIMRRALAEAMVGHYNAMATKIRRLQAEQATG